MIYDQLLKFSSLFFIFANEYENKLKEKLIREQSKIEKDDEQNDRGSLELILLRHDLVPIEPGRYGHESSFLGAGGSFQVYRVGYKGKHAVAKLTFSKSQFETFIRFSELRNKIPEKYKKHIPIIFDTIQNDQNKEYIVVMEELRPTNKYIRKVISSGFHKNFIENKIKFFIQNCDSFIQTILRDSNLLNYYIQQNKENEYDKVAEQIISFVKDDIKYLFKARSDLELESFRWENEKKLVTFLASLEIPDKFVLDISDKYKFLIFDLFKTGPFPEKECMHEGQHNELPETQSLLEFLKYLKSDFGIRWVDMKSKNIMERPGTKDLVVSDPGEFYGL